MALNNTNYGRDAVYINNLLLETQSGLNGHYFTLSTEGRDVVTKDQETGQYEPKVITVHYAIDGATASSFKDNLDYLQHLLNRKDADISFNDEYDLFMVGDIHNLGLEEKHATWGLGSYEIVCENPLKYSKTIGEVTATQVDDGEQFFSINYEGTAPMQPVILVTPGAENTSAIYPDDANLEFINVLKQLDNKNVSIGSSYPDQSASSVSNVNFKVASLMNLRNNGWVGDLAYCTLLTKSDPYYNRGEGLSYKALYPSSYNAEGTEDPDDPAASNRLVYKSLSTAINNFVCAYGVRMWASSIIAGGSLKLTAKTTDNNETGVVIYKNSLDNLKGKVLYYVDGKVMGSDTIDLSQYSHSLGLTDRQNGIVSRMGKNYFQDEVVNKKRPRSTLVEPKFTGSYVYTPSNNNVIFSKMGQVYTFKVADLPTRRFTYMRESGTDIGYNQLNIGFKPNMISSSAYPALDMQITGIDILSLANSNLLNNWGILTAGNTFEINPANLDLYRCMEKSGDGIYAPEYVGLYNAENTLTVEPEYTTAFQVLYYNKTTGNDPEVKVKYNTIYI